MTLEEELAIAKSRIIEEVNFVNDDMSYREGLMYALKIIEDECSSESCRK